MTPGNQQVPPGASEVIAGAPPAQRTAREPSERCGLLVHGMGRDLAEPDWPPLTDDEVSAVLARYGRPGGAAVVSWRSPRPMSAAALVRCGVEEVFVKRHHTSVRTAGQLAAEHALAAHLRALGVAVPAVLSLAVEGDREGATVTRE